MKIARLTSFIFVVALIGVAAAVAAPVESVESARTSAAFQKVDAFLGEKIVTDQLTSLGLSADQARARLANLSEAQITQLAAQIDLLQAGGKIKSAHLHPLGPLCCIIRQIHDFTSYVIHFLFCWDEIHG